MWSYIIVFYRFCELQVFFLEASSEGSLLKSGNSPKEIGEEMCFRCRQLYYVEGVLFALKTKSFSQKKNFKQKCTKKQTRSAGTNILNPFFGGRREVGLGTIMSVFQPGPSSIRVVQAAAFQVMKQTHLSCQERFEEMWKNPKPYCCMEKTFSKTSRQKARSA